MPRHAFEEAETETLQIVVSGNVEASYFDFGFFAQATLIGRHAGRITKSHVPIAPDAKAELAAAMVAAHRHELSLHEVSGCVRYSKVIGGVPTARQ